MGTEPPLPSPSAAAAPEASTRRRPPTVGLAVTVATAAAELTQSHPRTLASSTIHLETVLSQMMTHSMKEVRHTATITNTQSIYSNQFVNYNPFLLRARTLVSSSQICFIAEAQQQLHVQT